MKRAYFITGTDTGVGKTCVSAAWLLAANRQGLATQAIKPVAAGCERTAEGLRNDDALQLMQAMSEPLAYGEVNPVALEAAIAPHIAAARAGIGLRVDTLAAHCRAILDRPADLTLVEGAGGWRVPLNEHETLADLAKALGLPVILVVGLRLGCINHALLAAEAIRHDGLSLAGWVANTLQDGMPEREANIAALQDRLGAPCLGVVPWLATRPGNLPGVIAGYLEPGKLA